LSSSVRIESSYALRCSRVSARPVPTQLLHQPWSLGGGTVESHPEEVAGRSVSSSFLHNGSVSMLEAPGFERRRAIGKDHWVVSKMVSANPK
jgi:hypothetical protein